MYLQQLSVNGWRLALSGHHVATYAGSIAVLGGGEDRRKTERRFEDRDEPGALGARFYIKLARDANLFGEVKRRVVRP